MKKPQYPSRIHELRSILVDFKSVLNLIERGYRFDDDEGPEVIEQLKKSVSKLEEHIHEFEKTNK